jgi:SAM-dependent methyltransferase
MNKETEMVKALYSGMVDREWGRLDRDTFHNLEYKTTWRFIKEYLPETGLVLDAGGGPGRYTIELARRGYEVVLLDLVAANLERAREEIAKAGVGGHVKQVIEGNITDLSQFADNSFDAVLCLGGPLSHVCPESARLKAESELVRVAKHGSCIFVSVISKYGVLLATPEGWPLAVADPIENFPGLVETGDDYAFVKNGYCHFFTSAELEQTFADGRFGRVQYRRKDDKQLRVQLSRSLAEVDGNPRSLLHRPFCCRCQRAHDDYCEKGVTRYDRLFTIRLSELTDQENNKWKISIQKKLASNLRS